MKKIVLKLDLHDNKEKQRALKSVSTCSGIDSIAMDMKEKKMTVIGTVDPVTIVSKLRKYWPTTSLISVGPAKEPEKKEEPKKEGETPKKEEDAKKGGGEAKKDGAAGEAKKDGGEGKKDEGEAKKDEGEAKKEEGEAKKDGGGGGGEKKVSQPAAGQPHPIQLIPQFQHLPMPYPQPYPYPYPQPQSDPRIMELVKAYRAQAHNPQYTTHYHVQSMEENPNACVIC